MIETTIYHPTLEDLLKAQERLAAVVRHTPLQKNDYYSEKYGAQISFKREDLQVVRSYKIRGAYNCIAQLGSKEKKVGVVCASAGNHAQGVAYACKNLDVKAHIYMPATTPRQKIDQVKYFGRNWVEIVLTGDSFDDAYTSAKVFSKEKNTTFIHPFDDEAVIEGQGTVGLEILSDTQKPIDYLFLPVGGGGLSAGVSAAFQILSPETKIIGVEPSGAPSMKTSIEAGKVVSLSQIDRFVDGASVKKVGEKTFHICKQHLHDILLVPEGHICTTMLNLYSKEAIVLEPAGALSISAFAPYAEQIKGKNVVAILSGGNNDISRTEEIRERSMLHEGLKHYFIIRFPQRAGALREFLVDVLGPTDDIVHFEYTKKTSREKGPALIGIEHHQVADFQPLLEKLKAFDDGVEYLNHRPHLMGHLI